MLDRLRQNFPYYKIYAELSLSLEPQYCEAGILQYRARQEVSWNVLASIHSMRKTWTTNFYTVINGLRYLIIYLRVRNTTLDNSLHLSKTIFFPKAIRSVLKALTVTPPDAAKSAQKRPATSPTPSWNKARSVTTLPVTATLLPSGIPRPINVCLWISVLRNRIEELIKEL